MKLLVLYRPHSDHRQMIEEMFHEFSGRHPAMKVEMVDIDKREGLATASLYDIVRYPSIMALTDDGRLLQSWQGVDEMPRIDDLSYYSFDSN